MLNILNNASQPLMPLISRFNPLFPPQNPPVIQQQLVPQQFLSSTHFQGKKVYIRLLLQLTIVPLNLRQIRRHTK